MDKRLPLDDLDLPKAALTQEQIFQRDLRRVARMVGDLPFGSLLTFMVKAVIAFWLANVLIAAGLMVVAAVVLAVLGDMPR